MVSALISQASRYILNPAHFPTVACGAAVGYTYISFYFNGPEQNKNTTSQKKSILSSLSNHLVDSLTKIATTVGLFALSQTKPIQRFLPKSYSYRVLVLSSLLILKSVDVLANACNIYQFKNKDKTIDLFRHRLQQLSSLISIVSSLALMRVALTYTDSVKRGLGSFALGLVGVALNFVVAGLLSGNKMGGNRELTSWVVYGSPWAILGTAAVVNRCFGSSWLVKHAPLTSCIMYSIFNILLETCCYNSLKRS